jgi:hypothetical protein
MSSSSHSSAKALIFSCHYRWPGHHLNQIKYFVIAPDRGGVGIGSRVCCPHFPLGTLEWMMAGLGELRMEITYF